MAGYTSSRTVSGCASEGPAASHHARLDVLVGDLLVVIGAPSGRMHGRGRHGIEGEDELLAVTHAGRLGVIAWYACRAGRQQGSGEQGVSSGAGEAGCVLQGAHRTPSPARLGRRAARSAWVPSVPPQETALLPADPIILVSPAWDTTLGRAGSFQKPGRKGKAVVRLCRPCGGRRGPAFRELRGSRGLGEQREAASRSLFGVQIPTWRAGTQASLAPGFRAAPSGRPPCRGSRPTAPLASTGR